MNILKVVYEWPTWLKRLIQLIWDSFSLSIAMALAYIGRLGIESVRPSNEVLYPILLTSGCTIVVLYLLGHYRQISRYLVLSSFSVLASGLAFSVVFLYLLKVAFAAFIPGSVPILHFAFAFVLLAAPRMLIMLSIHSDNYKHKEKCLIFGAERAGRSLALALMQGQDLHPVAFVDAKRKYVGSMVLGIPVMHVSSIKHLVEKYDISKVLLAVNNTSAKRRQEILKQLEPYAIELLAVPEVSEIASGKRKINDIREVKIEELLGREPVPPIDHLLNKNTLGKVVMVTGAGGSIGSELCRQVAKTKPSRLVLLELSEFNIYQIEQDLSVNFPELDIEVILTSVQDEKALKRVIVSHGIQTIYHAAAYKHVPIVEANCEAGIRNNVFGTASTARVAAELGVEKFVLVSTDKAVRPTNIMGATKRLCELYVQGIAKEYPSTDFAIVRFGNVLGSSGSVVPLFERQLRAGGPLTVTHRDMIRYFMTIPEAAQLVVQAGALGARGEVFVLDMGAPIKIADLAVKMAHLLGFSVTGIDTDDGDVDIVYIGLRPGEKLYEELLIGDADIETMHPRILAANEFSMSFSEVTSLLKALEKAMAANDDELLQRMLIDAPLAYQPLTPLAQSA